MSFELATLILEILATLVALFTVFRGRTYMLGFVVSIGIYTLYDFSKLYNWKFMLFNPTYLPIVFFIASVGLVFSMWEVYRD